MKNHIKDIVLTFVSFNYSKKINLLFQRWLVQDNQSYEKEKALEKLWADTKASADKSTDEAFVKVMHNVGIEIISERKLYHFPILRYAAAIAIICISVISSSLFLVNSHKDVVSMVEHYVKKGKTESIILPDGSIALVNSETLIYYPNNFEGSERSVYLMGEATFNVTKDPEKPFVVHSNNIKTIALGTKFNVKAYAEDNEIVSTLLQGKVKIDCKNDSVYILNSGEQITYNKNTCKSKRSTADTESVTAWQRGEILLKEATVSEILNVLERHFGVEFYVKGEAIQSNDCYCFEFKKDASLAEVLDIMKIVIRKFDYRIKNNVCYISLL